MRKATLAVFALVVCAIASGSALANGRGGRVHFGVFVGGPLYWGPGYWGPAYYYPPPYYYYPPPAYYPPASPPVYVEREDAPASAQGWWYYCEQSRGYYPYVKECPGGWKRVPPAPAPG